MKATVADYATLVHCVRIEPANDAPIVRLAGYPTDLVMTNGQVYRTESGYEFSGHDSTTTFASSSIDLTGILQMGAISHDDLMSGVYDNARLYLFATSWKDGMSVEDEEPLGLFFFGKVDITDDKYSVQLMGAIDALSQSTGRTYAPTCPHVLFDETLDGRVLPWAQSKCTGPRAAQDGPLLASYKVTGTLTAVTDQYTITDSARAEAADYFAYGTIRFTTGPNAGLKPVEIKSYASGAITVHEAFFYLPTVGDAYEMIPGCRKDPATCKTKYGNKINFGGHDHIPAPTQYTQIGRGA